MDVAFRRVSYKLAARKGCFGGQSVHPTDNFTILDDVSGSWRKGQLVGIFGVSGSGKSTLLECLAGRKRGSAMSGTVWIGGTRMDAGVGFPGAGYVDQDDCFVTNLTVRETLTYSLDLRVPNAQMSRARKQRRVTDILELLHLQRVADARIGDPLKRGISGGERRRLTVGLELMTLPPVLFCDEITTGLSARDALRVMRIVQRLCNTGRHTVICTIHQPRTSIFHMFDEILLLHQGRTVYCGPGGANILGYFDRMGFHCPMYTNPADWLLDLMVDEDEFAPDPEFEDPGSNQASSSKTTTDVRVPVHFAFPTAISLQHRRELSTTSLHTMDVFRRFETQGRCASAAQLADAFNSSTEKANLLNNLVTSELEVWPQQSSNSFALAKRGNGISGWNQCATLTRRSLVDTLRSPAILYTRTAATIFVAVFCRPSF